MVFIVMKVDFLTQIFIHNGKSYFILIVIPLFSKPSASCSCQLTVHTHCEIFNCWCISDNIKGVEFVDEGVSQMVLCIHFLQQSPFNCWVVQAWGILEEVWDPFWFWYIDFFHNPLFHLAS